MASSKKSVKIPESAFLLPDRVRKIGSLASGEMTQEIDVTVLVRPVRASAKLPDIEELGSRMPSERQHLSISEYETLTRATRKDLNLVAKFARSNGLTVVETHQAERRVNLSGTPEAFEAAFNIRFEKYERVSGETFRGYDKPVSVPAELGPVVEGVLGLDDFSHDVSRIDSKFYPQRRKRRGRNVTRLQTYTAFELADLYNFPPWLDGRGQCIGVISMAGGYRKSDIQGYFKRHKMPMPTVVDNGENIVSTSIAANLEVTLDIQVAGSIAPGARIVVYFAKQKGLTTPDKWCEVIKRAVKDKKNKPSVLSISWGNSERNWQPSYVRAINNLLEGAVHMGITTCVASGDWGAMLPVGNNMLDTQANVSFPASSPNVLSVGGSTLIKKRGGLDEVVWNTLAKKIQFETNEGVQPWSGGATTGGVSTYCKLPDWQKQADVPKYDQFKYKDGELKALSSFSGRGVPDVAANADFIQSNYEFYFNGVPWVGGGTSAATPLWAGLIARINQGLRRRVGLVNPLLYQLQLAEDGPLRPITQGNNGYYWADSRRGWNPCTGLGTPDGTRLLEALRG